MNLPAGVSHDNWLTSIIKKEAFLFHLTDAFIAQFENKGSAEYLWISSLKNKPTFVASKVEPERIDHIAFIEKIGFNLIDTNVVLQKKNETIVTTVAENYTICFAMDADAKQTTETARKSFIYTRFHLDGKFSKEAANTVKAEWVRNYFIGQRGTHMVLAKINNEIAGFLQLIKKNDQLIIDLIAVDPDHRRKGIAQQMIHFAQQNISGCKTITVGTQLANIPSIKLYQRIGFMLDSAKYVFHYHSN